MALRTVLHCCKLLAGKGLTIAFAESATAGRIASEFSLSAHSGEVLVGGLVCYDACLKQELLKVPNELIDRYTPESAEVTKAMAENLPEIIKADFLVAVTGLTAPGGSETADKPVGTMFIHVAGKRSLAIRREFKAKPEAIIKETVKATAKAISKLLA